MSSDFSDMEDYECNKNSKCPRHNIFEGMTDEEIKNLFNDKKEEKKEEIKFVQLDEDMERLAESMSYLRHIIEMEAKLFPADPNSPKIKLSDIPKASNTNCLMSFEEFEDMIKRFPKEKSIHIGDELDDNGKPTGVNKILENNRFTPDELIEKVSESYIDHSDYDTLDYYKYLKEHHPEFLNLKPFKKLINDPGDLPDDIVPLPYEYSLGYNPTEYPELDKALKDNKDLVKPGMDEINKYIEAFKKLNTSKIDDKSDIPSGVNYGKCGGIKNDMNKPQLSLVPMQMVRDAALARMYGNNKYKDVPGYSSNNWCTIDKQRVIDALLRHILLYLEDMDGVDSESGLPHLCHVAANLSFLCEMQQPNWEEKKNKIIDNDPILSKSKPKE